MLKSSPYSAKLDAGLPAQWLTRLMAGLVLAVLLVPTLTVLSPRLYFDVDPRPPTYGVQALTHLGPAATMTLHAVTALVGTAALLVGLKAGAQPRWWSALAVAGGACFVAGWGLSSRFEDRLHGAALLSAAALALGLLHLGQIPLARRWLVAGLIAALIPMTVDAFWFVFVEHPETVRHFHENQADFLAARGMEAGSAEHQLYLRRITFTDATGPFGLANVFASVLAAGSLLAAGVGLGSLRVNRQAALIALLTALAGLGALALTHSKGGVLALGAGVAMAAAALAGRRWPVLARWVPGLGLLGLTAIVSLVLLRGAMGPPSVEVGEAGERSLLFRAQYWSAAGRMIAETPWTGQGVQGFANAYLRLKDPLNPEEVSNAHNVVVDYVAMYGVGGWLWGGLLLSWFWMAARQVRPGQGVATEIEAADTSWRVQIYTALAVGGGLFLFWYRMEVAQLWWLPTLVMLGSMVAFSVVLAVLARPGSTRSAALNAGLLAAATALLGQGMIEMTWIQPSSVTLAWAMLALAAAGTVTEPQKKLSPLFRQFPALVPAVLTLLLMAGFWLPMQRHERLLATAHDALRTQTPQGTASAIHLLDQAAEQMPADRTIQRWRVALRLELATAAARSGSSRGRQLAQQMLDEARQATDQAASGGLQGPAPHRLQAEIAQLAAELGLLAREDAGLLAAEHLQQALKEAPYSLRDTERLADLYWETDNLPAAAHTYRRLLELSDQAYLDSAKQLPADRQQRARERIAAVAD